MECPVCYDELGESTYTIGCGASHVICNNCETEIRLRSKNRVLAVGFESCRPITCPLCRGLEKVAGKRSDQSIQAEFKQLYAELAMHSIEYQLLSLAINERAQGPARARPAQGPARARPAQARPVKSWCVRKQRGCTTQSKTARRCSAVLCTVFVCRSCSRCDACM